MSETKRLDDGGPAFPDPMRGAPQSIGNQYPDLMPMLRARKDGGQ